MKLQQWAQDWFAAWQASHTDSSRTAQSYQGLLQNTILPRLGKYELAELTSLQLKHFLPVCPAGRPKIPTSCCGPSSNRRWRRSRWQKTPVRRKF